uniref:PSP domain-containing protein n=1 Tax=Parastrongyloides trichosuri TaxID=131310 RepID=A0A0N5A3D3_PARTI
MQFIPGTFLGDQYLSALTAYGPGINIFTPWTYVDLAYDNIPFVGKLPVLGKDGTSSYALMSPQQLKEGNPIPPIYLAKPLPPHVPEPVEVVAVPLDEEALHGEPLFPKELPLPWAKTKQTNKDRDEKTGDKLKNPFASEEMDLSDEEEITKEKKPKTVESQKNLYRQWLLNHVRKSYHNL